MDGMKQVFRSFIVAVTVWAFFAALALFFWYGIASDCCADLKYFHGVSRFRGEAKLGWISQAEAEQLISEMEQQYLKFVWDTSKLPLCLSVLAVPLLAILLFRWKGDTS
ncbi:hypothetical protein FBQ82_16045 [Anaerolineae bacterium CFX7]|nr:hypothetical protein [Anaerolineae bacterium CFX7]